MSNAEIFTKICALIAPLNKTGAAIQATTTFQHDLEMDSLTVMDLVADIEDEFDIILPLNLLPELETVQQVTDTVEKIMNEGA